MRTTQDFLCLLVNVRWCDGFLFSKYYGEALTQELFSGGNLANFPNPSLLKGELKISLNIEENISKLTLMI